MKKSIRIFEVGPRDGLQNEKEIVSTSDKFEFIQRLAAAGLTNIEVTSFVRVPKIPQMSDATELFKLVNEEKSLSKLNLSALVPNLKGLHEAEAMNVKEVAIFTATSDEFNRKNINTDAEGSLLRFVPVAQRSRDLSMRLRGYISTVFGCPYEGEQSIDRLQYLIEKLFALDCYDISLGDTIGIGTPDQVYKIVTHLKKNFELSKISLHFHDTRGFAAANILAGFESGIRSFDSCAGGIGGCPYAKGAAGNVATEDLVYLFSRMGIETGVDLDKLLKASSFILSILKKESPSKLVNVLGSSYAKKI